jgi:hypothetical protein
LIQRGGGIGRIGSSERRGSSRRGNSSAIVAICAERFKADGAATGRARTSAAKPPRGWPAEGGRGRVRQGSDVWTARDKFRPILEQSTPEQLHGMADEVRSFALTGTTFGNMAEAAVSMNSGLGGIVYFENVNGEWRISEM